MPLISGSALESRRVWLSGLVELIKEIFKVSGLISGFEIGCLFSNK